MLQLNPPLPLKTPKGDGLAHFLLDYGPESDLYWTVFIAATGEIWTFANREVRADKNITLGRTRVDVEQVDEQRPDLHHSRAHPGGRTEAASVTRRVRRRPASGPRAAALSDAACEALCPQGCGRGRPASPVMGKANLSPGWLR